MASNGHAAVNGSTQTPPDSLTDAKATILSVNLNQAAALDPAASDPAASTTGGKPLSSSDYNAYRNITVQTPAEAKKQKFPRISKPVPLLRTEYDVVVVGSGYGGGVAASRMSRAGKSVCVLELGKEKWPGEYPVKLGECARELHVSGNVASSGQPVKDLTGGDKTGLYHLVLGEGQNAFVANGLGGTSLLNANIFLEADPRTLAMQCWPPEIRNDPNSLKKYYERAASVLQPRPYPKTLPTPKKLSFLEQQAEAMGWADNFYRPPQTTWFEADGLNSTGVMMRATTGSGQDCTGVNDGSKSSVLMNYLPDAWNWGAEIFCECEVRHVKKDPSGKGYIVFFAWHGNKRSKFDKLIYQELMWVRAKEFCFLGAGTLGTTEVLLRSRNHGLKVSNCIGRQMSGNGDVLAFAYNSTKIVNAVGQEHVSSTDPVGPTITGVIDRRDAHDNVLDGYVIEEGAAPEALAKFLLPMMEFMPGSIRPEDVGVVRSFGTKLSQRLADLRSKIGGPYAHGGSVDKSQIYLVMSHDSNQATLTLENDKAYLRFLGVGTTEHVAVLTKILADMSAKFDATLVNSPFYGKIIGKEEITVHPIGGAVISPDGTGRAGVTDHLGRVYCDDGNDVHDGLVCCDGSVVPTALGVNPFATITALAERSVDLLAEAHGLHVDCETTNGALDLFGPPKIQHNTPLDVLQAAEEIADAGDGGMRFSEVMDGWIYIGDDIVDFKDAAQAAEGSSSSARFYLSVDAWNTATLIDKSDHAAMLTGTFSCGALSKDPFMVERGLFQLFSDDLTTPDTKNLVYKFDMSGTDGRKISFEGYKVVDPSIQFSISKTWKATSTLYVTLREAGKVIGRGILTIGWRNFADELKTTMPTGTGVISRAWSAASFLWYFAGNTTRFFFSPFSKLQYPAPFTASTSGKYPGKIQPSLQTKIMAVDGVESAMLVWDPPVQKSTTPILLVPGASVDHQIFSLDKIPTSTVDFLLSHGFKVYCVTHRVGKSPAASSSKGYTTFDARLDVKAALDHVIKDSPPNVKPYCLVHCAGSCAMASGLLDGTISADLMCGMTASNVFMNPTFALLNKFKSNLPLPLPTVYGKLAGQWYNCASSVDDTLVQRALNQALRFYPVRRGESCNSVVCHRSELAFGRLWTHKNLNEATHANLDSILGGVTMKCLKHLMASGNASAVLDNDEISLVNDANVERLRGLPILFIHGGQNNVYGPENVSMSYDKLRHFFKDPSMGSGEAEQPLYQKWVFQNRGHLDCWMGKSSYMDVYPRLLEHIQSLHSGAEVNGVGGK